MSESINSVMSRARWDAADGHQRDEYSICEYAKHGQRLPATRGSRHAEQESHQIHGVVGHLSRDDDSGHSNRKSSLRCGEEVRDSDNAPA